MRTSSSSAKATLDAVAGEIRAAGGVAETAVVDALDRAAVDAHARSLDASAGGIDISFNAVAVDVEQNVPLVDMPIVDFIGPIDGLSGHTSSLRRRPPVTWWSVARA